MHSTFTTKEQVEDRMGKAKDRGKGAIAKQRDEILQKDGRECSAFFPPEAIFFISGNEFLSF